MLRQLLAQHRDRRGLIPFPVERFAAADPKSVPVNKFFTLQLNQSPLQMRRPKKRAQDLKLLSETPLASRAITIIRKAIQSLQWGVQLKDTEKRTPSSKQTPEQSLIMEVLNYPSKTYKSWKRFIGPVVEDLLVYDAGAWEYVEKPTPGKNGKNAILGLEPVAGLTLGQVTKWKPGDTGPRWGQVDDVSRVVATFTDDQIEYIMMRERTTAILGLSPLEVAIEVLDAWLKLQTMQKTKGSETLPDLVNLGEMTTSDDITQMRMLLQQRTGEGIPIFFGGFGEKQKPEVLNLRAISDAMMLLNYDEHLIRLFGLCFDLSPMDLNLERDVNRSTSETFASASVLQAIKPTAELIQEIFNQEVIPRIGVISGNKKVEENEFFFRDLTPRDEQKFSAMLMNEADHDIRTIDEIRAEFNLKPLASGNGKMTLTEYRATVQYPADPLSIEDPGASEDDQQSLEQPADEQLSKKNGNSKLPTAASSY